MYKLIIAFTLLSLLGCASVDTADTPSEAATAEQQTISYHFTQEQLNLAGVKLGRPEKRTINSFISCTGSVDVPPQSLHSVYAPVTGFVESVPFIVGNYVRKGALLTRLSHPGLVQLQGTFLEARSRMPFLKNEFDRLQVLAEKEAASQQALQKAEAEWKAMEAHYQSLKAELEVLGLNAGKLEETGEIQKFLPMYAPANGYLIEVNVNPGKLVSPDQILFQMVDNSHMHLELQVFAKDALYVQKEAPIRFRVPGTEEWFTGDVYLTGQVINPETKTTRVHGHFDNEPIHLFPGTYVQAEITIPSDSVWTVPLTALIRQEKHAYLFRKEGEHFFKDEVQVGKSDENYAELINYSLPAANLLVVDGAYYLNAAEEEPEHSH